MTFEATLVNQLKTWAGIDDEAVAAHHCAAGDLAANATGESYRVRRAHDAWVIEASEPAGVRYAMIDIARRDRRRIDEVVTPSFDWRGLLEGFYGPPWSPDERLGMISFAGRHRFNWFMYSPKDDAHLRRHWRLAHDDQGRRHLGDVIDAGREHGVRIMVGISPGLSMQYSNADDQTRLVERVTELVELGADGIALLFDDIPASLQHETDQQQFPDLATAHAATSNLVAAALDDVPLVVCPTRYHGRGDEAYVTGLCQQLSDGVEVFWTGRAICSPEISSFEADIFHWHTGQAPLYWDNYPVNDVAMTHELHVGPYQRRDADLGDHCAGLFANAMQYPIASQLSLATVADYLWNSTHYDPETSMKAACSELTADSDDATALAIFVDNSRVSCLSDPDAELVGDALQRFEFDVEYRDAATALAELGRSTALIEWAAERLTNERFTRSDLQAEIRPWLRKFTAGSAALRAYHAFRSGTGTRGELRHAYEIYRAHPQRLFGDVLDMTIADALSDAVDPDTTPSG